MPPPQDPELNEDQIGAEAEARPQRLSVAARLSLSMSLDLQETIIPLEENDTRPSTRHRTLQEIFHPMQRVRQALGNWSFSSSVPTVSSSEEPVHLGRTAERLEPRAFQTSEGLPPILPVATDHRTEGWWRVRNQTGRPSTQEGSTIDNIYKSYNRSDLGSHTSRQRPHQSFDPNLSKLTDEQSFFSAEGGKRDRCPQRPGYMQQGGPSSHDYGVQSVGLPRSIAQNNISSAYSGNGQDDSDLADITDIRSSRNIRELLGTTTLESVRNGENSSSSLVEASRPPLERAIMQLRRHSSDASGYSNASRSTVKASKFNDEKQTTQRSRPVSEAVSVDEETRRLAQPALLYERVSRDPNWNATQANSLHLAAQNQFATGSFQGSMAWHNGDGEDWETIRTTHSDFRQSRDRYSEMSACYTDFSGDTWSTIDEISRFDSRERIVQHPGKIDQNRDVGKLKLAKGKTPCIAPNFVGNRVNGYAADSMRTGVQNPYYATRSPLAESHKNPFVSKPPMLGPHNSQTPFESDSTISSRITQHGYHYKGKYPRRMDHLPQTTFASKSSYGTQRNHQLGQGSSNPYKQTRGRSSRGARGSRSGRRNHRSLRRRALSRNQATGFTEVDLYAGDDGRADRLCPSRNPFTVVVPTHTFDIEMAGCPDEEAMRMKVSCIFLVLCNFFPVLLPFYAAGKLDSLVSLVTKGEIRKLKLRTSAMALSVLWFVAVLVGLVILCVKVTYKH